MGSAESRDVNKAVSALGQGHMAEAVIFGLKAEASCEEVEAKVEAKPKYNAESMHYLEVIIRPIHIKFYLLH